MPILKDGGRMAGEWTMCHDNGYIDDMLVYLIFEMRTDGLLFKVRFKYTD